MCTVTYIPLKDKILITSNRDELKIRTPAVSPQLYDFPNGRILFPKDGQAGGTWIGLHQNGNAMVLLNGAFVRHEHRPPYRLSRGIIFLNIFDAPDPKGSFESIDLDNIEPFTLLIFQQGSLWETKWDGTQKHVFARPADVPLILSSVTLYDAEVREQREHWFVEWLKHNPQPVAADIRKFHEFGGEGDDTINFRMNRNGKLLTVSITGMEIAPGKATMHYKDMVTDIVSVSEVG
jgi:hypothetical protein